MTQRDAIISAAAARIGPYVKGSPEVDAICRLVLPPTWTDAQCKQYDHKDWCGLFALACLRDAGVTDASWRDGIGFIGPLHLKQVDYPKPGDIAFKGSPFQHHMVVEYWNHALDWGDIAGNTPTAARHKHASSAGVTFYSVESLLPVSDTEPAGPPSEPLPEGGFIRGQKYSVPGIEDEPGGEHGTS